jgi:CRISPR/Cas system-associated endonuclease/helicase Cas3
VDECHLVFMLDNWRLKLALLKNLQLLGCLIVLMTATLPPVWEHALELSMLVHNATYIQVNTVQLNTQYFILWVQRNKIEETAVVVCLQRQAQLQKEGQKGVVYC